MAIHIALAKGRIHKAVMAYLQESGYAFPTYTADSRKLIFEDSTGTLKVTLVKSPDVAVYVERGAADVGIVGEDVLLEEAPGAGVYEIFDLGIGRCRMAVAAIAGKPVDMTKRITVGDEVSPHRPPPFRAESPQCRYYQAERVRRAGAYRGAGRRHRSISSRREIR